MNIGIAVPRRINALPPSLDIPVSMEATITINIAETIRIPTEISGTNTSNYNFL
jgi:hypothetical protein